MSVIMIADKVLIKRDPIETVTEGGIEIPEEYQTDPNTGTIVAIGEGNIRGDGTRTPLTVNEGDKVILPDTHRFGQIVMVEGEEFIVCREFEIPVIIRPEKVENDE